MSKNWGGRIKWNSFGFYFCQNLGAGERGDDRNPPPLRPPGSDGPGLTSVERQSTKMLENNGT